MKQERGHGGNHLAHTMQRQIWLNLAHLLFLSVLLGVRGPVAIAAGPAIPPARLLFVNAAAIARTVIRRGICLSRIAP